MAAGAASSCPVFSQLLRRISLSTAQGTGTGGGRERNSKGKEVERGTVPIPLKESRLVNCVLESTVSTDWMAALLSAPGVVSCSLGYYALVSAVDLIHLFSLILPSQMFVPLQFSWFASWKFVNFTRNFGWRCYFLFFTVLAWDKL